MNTEKLRTIANSTPTAETVILSLATRERDRSELNLQRMKTQLLKSGEKVVDKDFAQLWLDLQSAGIGHVVMKKGKPNRFDWSYSIKQIARSLINNTPIELSRVESKAVIKPKRVPKPEAPQVVIRRVFVQLKDNVSVQMAIPENITKAEFANLVKALETAAF